MSEALSAEELEEWRSLWEGTDTGDEGHPERLLATIDSLQAENARLREQAEALEAELATVRTSETIAMWRGAATLERAGFTVTGLDAEVKRLREQAEALAAALAEIVSATERWNASVETIIGRQPNTSMDLVKADAALRAYREA